MSMSISHNPVTINDLYSNAILTQKVTIPFILVGSNIKNVLEKSLSNELEGKCIVEGYVKSGSVNIITFSCGTLNGKYIEFEVVFKCGICCPVEGMKITCYAKNITQAGIRAFTNIDEKQSPVIIYISRDHHLKNDYFNSIQVRDEIEIRVIGQRFELNDKQVSIIGELLQKKHKPLFREKEKEKGKEISRAK